MMKQTEGFSLIGAVCVIAILAILSVYALSSFPTTAAFNLTSISDQLRRDIRYTQMLALSQNASYSIQILAGSYTISPTPAPGPATMTMPSGVVLSAPQTITFDATGRPGAATTVTVTTSTGSTVLTLSAQTGFVNG